MTVVGWQLQRAVTHYRTEELLLVYMYFILFILIYKSSTSYQPSLCKQSDEIMRGYMIKENKTSENVPFSYSNRPVQRAEFQSSQRRTKKQKQMDFVSGDEGKTTINGFVEQNSLDSTQILIMC
jgi:hypothetical protein